MQLVLFLIELRGYLASLPPNLFVLENRKTFPISDGFIQVGDTVYFEETQNCFSFSNSSG